MKSWIWPSLLIVTIFMASGSNPASPVDISGFDKVIHFLVFGLVAAILVRCRKPITWTWVLAVFLLVSGYGIFDEIRQSFTPGRSMEWQDWLADTLGAGISLLFYKTVPLYASILEAKLPGKTRQESTSENNTVS